MGSHDALECPGVRHICVVVHPICAQTELASGFCNTGSESLLHIGKSKRMILGQEGTVGVVDILGHQLGALVVGEQGMEGCTRRGESGWNKSD